MAVFSWGNNFFGQLGLVNDPENEDACVSLPTLVKSSLEVQNISCGWNHTLFLMKNGSVYSCGLNDQGQLGLAKAEIAIPEQITALESHFIKHASCGEAHSVIVSEDGQMFTFGGNSKGQLGSEKQSESVPRLIKNIPFNTFITQVSCGKHHTVALSSGGVIFSWGGNEFGQLGTGVKGEKNTSPTIVQSLLNCPVIQVVAGGCHTMALTISGSLFAWGCNNSGQLGLGDNKARLSPTKVPLLCDESVRHVALGEHHTVVLAANQRVFTFGAGTSGQLGHYSFEDEWNPKVVAELMGMEISHVACGRKHTFAFSAKLGRLFAFGLSVKGQLGLDSFEKKNNPVVVEGVWSTPYRFHKETVSEAGGNANIFYYENDLMDALDTFEEIQNGHTNTITSIYAGGLQSFALVVHSNYALPKFEYLVYRDSLLTLTKNAVEDIVSTFQKRSVAEQKRVVSFISTVFSHSSCLNGSFLARGEHEHTACTTHGIHLMAMKNCFHKLCSIQKLNDTILSVVRERLMQNITILPDIEAMRVFIMIPELPFFHDMDLKWQIIIPFVNTINLLQKESLQLLEKWWRVLPATFFERLVEAFRRCVMALLNEKLPERANQLIFTLHSALNTTMWVLEKLNKINNEVDSHIAYTTFYLPGLMKQIDMKSDYINWLQHPNVFSFCQYPFALDAPAKAYLLQIDAELQMKVIVNETHMMNLTGLVGGFIDTPIDPFLVLRVRRDNLLQDTLTEVLKHHPQDFKKPLKIKFNNEDAEDAGGVKKEFFLLLMREIVNPKYGMFDIYDESKVLWFKPGTFEGPEMFMLIGVICGLAIYNSLIVDFPFPLCLYKKLLNRKLKFDDLYGIQPDVVRNLQYMLDYQNDDFDDVFALSFQVVESHFGHATTVDLIPDGGNTRVTQDNKQQYVDAYVDYKINTSVRSEYEAFAQGFHRVCGGRVLELFQPQELMEMVVGSNDYDLNDLEKIAEYKGEYYRQHAVIKNFWQVFHSSALDWKEKFLAFLTGSSKVSILGIDNIKFIIQPVYGGEMFEKLPVAHTCFNLLDLPKYPTIELMRTKLDQAIENYEGFGLV